MAGVSEMLEPAMFIGLGAVAVWMSVRFPGLRPRSLIRATAHVIVSFGAFTLLPTGLSLALPLLSSGALRIAVTLALLMTGMTYLLLTWVWLIARILRDMDSNPRGGHPLSTES